MKHYKTYIGKSILCGLLMQTFAPGILLAAQSERSCCKKIVNADRVNTNTLCVRDGAKFGGDATIEGDLTVNGHINGDCKRNGICDDIAAFHMDPALKKHLRVLMKWMGYTTRENWINHCAQ